MYYVIGASVPSLYRESTNYLIEKKHIHQLERYWRESGTLSIMLEKRIHMLIPSRRLSLMIIIYSCHYSRQ